jgi:hypothetical protein
MQIALRILGVLFLLVGAVWTLQGVGILPGSVMTGSSFWAGAGIVCLLIGIGALLYSFRRPATPR